MKLFRNALIFLLFAAATFVNAGWIEDRNGKTIIHVKVHKLPDPTRNDAATRAEVAVVKLFKATFPEVFAKKYKDKYKADPKKYGKFNWDDVEIQLEKATGIRVEGVEDDLLSIAGGMSADILYINFRKSDTYIRNGFLYPLDEYMKELAPKTADGRINLKAIPERINPKLIPVIERKGPDGKMHIWAMPSGTMGKVLLFRKDLFDANDVPHPTKDWTWEHMIAAAKKMTDPEKGTVGIVLGKGKHESWHWITYLWSAGGEVMVYNEDKDEWACVFNTPEAAKALDFYIRLTSERWEDKKGQIHRGYAIKDGEISTKWANGEVAMQLAYINENTFATIDPDITGMVPVPLGPPDKNGKRIRGGEINSRMMGLFSEIKEVAVRDAAWEYMKFIDSEEATRLRTRIMVEGGLGQFINPKHLKKFGYPEIIRLSPKGWAETFEISIATGKPEPCGKNSNIAYDLMTIPINKAEQLSKDDKLPEDEEKRLEILHELLIEACDEANEKMIGKVTPEERVKRRVVAGIVLVFIVIVFTFVFRKIIKTFTPPSALSENKGSWQFRKYIWAYTLLMPAVLSIAVWSYTPLLRGSYMAFFDYKLIGESAFVGIDNFGDVLFSSDWWNAVWNALKYSTFVLALTFLPPIFLAILLQEIPKGKLFFRIVYYLPAVITGLVTILLWKQFFSKEHTGMLNAIVTQIPAIGFVALGVVLLIICLMFAKRLLFYEYYLAMLLFVIVGIILLVTSVGIASPILMPKDSETFLQIVQNFPTRLFGTMPEAFDWLNDSKTAMLACVIPMVWAGMGPGCLIYLAALKGIPDDYYEAADIDGATFIDKIMFVIFPMMKALIIINFVGAFIQSWYSATGNILVMTGGGANTETAGLHIWYQAFTYLKFGTATSMAWMLGFLLIGFTVHQLRILSRVEFKSNNKK